MVTKLCEICGKEFQSRNPRARYCKNVHYLPCPVCGKPVEVKQYPPVPRACSGECAKQRRIQTSMERYGVPNAGGIEASLEKQKKTNLERYGCIDSGNRPEAMTKRKETLRSKYQVDRTWDIPGVRDKVQDTNMKRYGVAWAMENADIKKKAVQGCIDKYGVSNPMQDLEVQNKVKKTNLDRYGTEWAVSSPQVRAKSQRTMINRYGTIHPTKLAEIQERIKATNIVRYGVCRPMMSEEVKRKVQETMIERYGVDNPQKSEDIKNRTRETNLKRYGVPAAICLPENMEKAMQTMRDNLGYKISSYNQKFGELLESVGLEIEYEKGVGGRWFDIGIKDSNILIEIDPTHTHSIQTAWYGKGLDRNYHRDKTRIAAANGYRCIHIFDWDDVEKILGLVLPTNNRYYGRQVGCEIISMQQAEDFLEEFHVQGSVCGQEICLGLIKDSNLLSVMTFGAPRYNRKYQWELLRYCTVPGVQVVGGASKLMRSFIKELDPNSILSYCNLAKFTGQVYEQIGMKKVRVNAPNKLWSKGSKVITDALLRQRGYDQLFGTSYGKGTSNEELMVQHGWRTVYDCGQAVYEWTKQSDLT